MKAVAGYSEIIILPKLWFLLPNSKKIYSASQYAVRSQGVLNFPELTLESGGNEGGHPAALFEIQVDNEQLKISDNASSVFKIKGQTKNLDIRFWSGAARFEGGESYRRRKFTFITEAAMTSL